MINVLMCTYNGEKYLSQQLDSIMNQTYKEFCLYIRDDGSTDSTLQIIRQYSRRFPNKIKIIDSISHLGYPDCFWDILAKCDNADYYAFSDQDDIWDEHKLEYSVLMMDRNDNTRPLLYIHDSYISNSKGDKIGIHKLTDAGHITDTRIMFYTIAQGFSMVINDAMRTSVLKEEVFSKNLSHDQWMIWNAFFKGNIVYDEHVLANYRRHENTVTKTAGGTFVMLSNWITNEIFGDEFHRQCNRLMTFLKYNKNYMSVEQKTDWELLLYTNPSIKNYFKRLFFWKRLRPSVGGELALRINFLLGMK